jgi:phosphoribosylamine--glycine ligase
MLAVATGAGLADHELRWSRSNAVTTVVAAAGYPDRPRKGDAITLPPPSANVHVFHAGTALASDGQLVTSGGRVLAVTAVAHTLAQAREDSARVAGEIELEGKQLRRDIGWREQERGAGASGN